MVDLVLGPPGTGKTTHLVREVEAFNRPTRVAFVSFTNAAVDEAVRRISDEEHPHARTIHSLAFRALGLHKDQVVGPADLARFADEHGEAVSKGGDRAVLPGDVYLRATEFAAATMRPIERAWPHFDDVTPGTTLQGCEAFAEAYAAFKRREHLFDFNDMLAHYLARGAPVDVDLAVVDEAQDLTTLQWRVVEWAFSTAKRVVIAGDDDQAIYAWAGADVEHFLSLGPSANVAVLHQSHRLPRAVHALAADLARQIERRYEKHFVPRAADGAVDYCGHVEGVDYDGDDVFVLARNGYLLDDVEAILRRDGVVYTRYGKPSVAPSDVETIKAWLAARRDPVVTGQTIRLFAQAIGRIRPSVRRHGTEDVAAWDIDVTQPWDRAFEGWSPERRAYYRAVLGAGRRLSSAPTVHLSTIHAAKGAQAKHVVLLTDVSARTARHLHTDAEHRVAYVGVTRAIERLTVVAPKGEGYRL